MISQAKLVKKFKDFTQVAAPLLFLKNAEAYDDALLMVEHLADEVEDNSNQPENLLLSLLAQAIHTYEVNHDETQAFEKEVANTDSDIAVLRVLIDQHQLTLSDLPEIGHKSLVSKILSGERNLTKEHIKKLCGRFQLEPGLFFGALHQQERRFNRT